MLTVEEIKTKLIPIFEAYGVQSATLFGSIAKGTATERSDLDLMVDSGLKGLRFVGLMDAVQNAVLLPINLLDISHIEKGSRIDREICEIGIVIYER